MNKFISQRFLLVGAGPHPGVTILVAVVVDPETDATNTLNHCLVSGNTCYWVTRYSKNVHVKLFLDSSCMRILVQLDISSKSIFGNWLQKTALFLTFSLTQPLQSLRSLTPS